MDLFDLSALIVQHGDPDEAAVADRILRGARKLVKHSVPRGQPEEPRTREERGSVVYFMEVDGLLKIGTTIRPEDRRQELDGKLIGTIPGSFDVEQKTLKAFGRWRLDRDRFVLAPPVYRAIRALCGGCRERA